MGLLDFSVIVMDLILAGVFAFCFFEYMERYKSLMHTGMEGATAATIGVSFALFAIMVLNVSVLLQK